jgi:hypothetical protein
MVHGPGRTAARRVGDSPAAGCPTRTAEASATGEAQTAAPQTAAAQTAGITHAFRAAETTGISASGTARPSAAGCPSRTSEVTGTAGAQTAGITHASRSAETPGAAQPSTAAETARTAGHTTASDSDAPVAIAARSAVAAEPCSDSTEPDDSGAARPDAAACTAVTGNAVLKTEDAHLPE